MEGWSCSYSFNLRGSHAHVPPRAPFVHRTIAQFWNCLDQSKLPTAKLGIICLHCILKLLVNMNLTKEQIFAG
ncbi:unnamed protein product [Prunus armeniaca]